MTEIISNKEYAQGTLTHFKTTYAHLSNFIKWKFHQHDIEVDKIDYSFIANFEPYLKTKVNQFDLTSQELEILLFTQ